MNLLPKSHKFLDLFERHSKVLCRASALLRSGLVGGYEGVRRIQAEMTKIEEDGDHVVKEIFGMLQSTFITPFDPEDIQVLATTLDDVIDDIEEATFRIVAYRLDPVPAAVTLLVEKVHISCSLLEQALRELNARRPVTDFCVEINRLENEADNIERRYLAELFQHETDPISLMRQKEIYELLEMTADRCEDAADVIEGIAVKNI